METRSTQSGAGAKGVEPPHHKSAFFLQKSLTWWYTHHVLDSFSCAADFTGSNPIDDPGLGVEVGG